MKSRPILFSAEMIRAMLDGRKGQTRRALKKQPLDILPMDGDRAGREWIILEQREPEPKGKVIRCRYGVPGDLLWVRCSPRCFSVYFKPIAFGDGKYAVGTDGKLYSSAQGDWAPVSIRLSHNGYEEATLRHEGVQQAFRVNRLVAEAFYGAPPSGMVCRHIDGNRRNNRPENLDWGTPAQNTADANAAARWSGSANGCSTLRDEQIAEIRASSEPQATLAARFGVTQPTISKIKSGKRWRTAHPEAPPRNLPAWSMWKTSIHSPRWASRLTLRITNIRVERLQEISEADARAEGVLYVPGHGDITPFELRADPGYSNYLNCRMGFRVLWERINGAQSWTDNSWVWAMAFDVIKANVDDVLKREAA